MREGQLGAEIENYESYLNTCTLRGIPIRSDTMKPKYVPSFEFKFDDTRLSS